jgi:D-alanine-D-alanine ligase
MNIDLTNLKIAVLKGGPGSERAVSMASARGVSAALQSLGANVTDVDVTGPDFMLPEGCELAFNVIHGTFGEDGQVQALLEKMGVNYTGEGVAGSELAFDKIATKECLRAHGVPTAEFEILRRGEWPKLALPYVIKAPREGSSVGVYIIKQESEIEPALDDGARFGDILLVEKYVSGHELTVGVLGDLPLPVIEIKPKDGFYDFKNKYPFLNPQAAGADHLCPAPLGAELTKLVQETALEATRALGLRVYSRVDILLDEAGQPSVLEINTIPGMTTASLLPEAAGVAGISYAQLCAKVIELSLAERPRP